jgi:hypothetical protein
MLLGSKESNMVRLLAIAAILGTTLVMANPSEGKPNKGASGQSQSHSMHRRSHPSHYRNWSSWSWNARYRCYFYLTDGCEYYWYAPANCYYPVTYLAQYPPTQCSYQQTSPNVAPLPIQITNINTNTLTNGTAIPAPLVPPGPLPKGP